MALIVTLLDVTNLSIVRMTLLYLLFYVFIFARLMYVFNKRMSMSMSVKILLTSHTMLSCGGHI